MISEDKQNIFLFLFSQNRKFLFVSEIQKDKLIKFKTGGAMYLFKLNANTSGCKFLYKFQ